MKNLENYGVQTLNAQEIRKTEGGQDLEPWLPWLDAAYEYITSLPWSDVLDEDPNMSIPISA